MAAEDGEPTAKERRRANLRIGAFRLVGFRAVEQLCLQLDPDLTVLLGENNTGKSSVLEAVGIALGTQRAVEDDLHLDQEGQRRGQFTIDLTLEPLDQRFDDLTAAVLGDAIQRTSNGQEYVGLRAIGRTAVDGSGVDVQRTFTRGWTSCNDDPASAVVVTTPPVGRAILDLVSYTLLDARRDLVADLRQRRTAWGRLLARLEIPPDLEAEISTQLEALGTDVIDASDLLRGLRGRLQAVGYALGSSVSDVALAPLPTRVEEVAQAIDVLVSAPGGAPIPLRQQGMGSRSLAALMVFQSFVEMRLGADLGLEPFALTALEEPEAHLHPQAQTAVASMLRALPGQKIVSTHAARIATDADLDQIRFLRRHHTVIRAHRTARDLEYDKAHKLRRLVLRPLGDLLFARLVILGDGATESDALRVFASAWWARDPDGMGVAIPELHGLGGDVAQALVPTLEDLGIPWLALVDGDDKAAGAVTRWEKRLGRSLDGDSDLVRLADGQGFEALLIEAGLQEQIADGIRAYAPEKLRDVAAGEGLDETHDDVLLKVLHGMKGTYGTPVATAIVEAAGADVRFAMPDAVRELFERADGILGVNA